MAARAPAKASRGLNAPPRLSPKRRHRNPGPRAPAPTAPAACLNYIDITVVVNIARNGDKGEKSEKDEKVEKVAKDFSILLKLKGMQAKF